MAITVIAIWGGVLLKRSITESPEDTLVEYMNHIEKKEYEAMYAMIDSEEKCYLEKEENLGWFVKPQAIALIQSKKRK